MSFSAHQRLTAGRNNSVLNSTWCLDWAPQHLQTRQHVVLACVSFFISASFCRETKLFHSRLLKVRHQMCPCFVIAEAVTEQREVGPVFFSHQHKQLWTLSGTVASFASPHFTFPARRHAKSAISNPYREAWAHWKELFQYYLTQAFALGSANMKQHRLYLISSSVEVRVRSIALITCRMTNEAAPGVKGGEEKVRQRKELADCGKPVQEDGCLKDTQSDERPLLLFLVLFFFFKHFLLLPGFFFRSLYIPGRFD